MGTSVGRSCPPVPAPDLKGSRQMADSVGEAMSAVEAYCESRVPEDLRDEIRIECARRG